MSDLEKAARLAMEALESCEDVTADVLKAITAIRQALEQPASKPWVGLTTEEVKEISLANRPYVVDMVVALEQRLKEKNA